MVTATDEAILRAFAKRIGDLSTALRIQHTMMGLPHECASALDDLRKAEATLLELAGKS